MQKGKGRKAKKNNESSEQQLENKIISPTKSQGKTYPQKQE